MTRFLTALAFTLAAAQASATSFNLDPARSAISFTYSENGTEQTGKFARLDGRAAFDAANPEAADMSLTIQSAGVDLGDPVRSHFAQSIDWFDAERHPDFSVKLDEIKEIAPGRYSAFTRILIKGREVGLPTEVNLSEEPGGRLRATGEVVINRHDYGLGVGFSSLFSTIDARVVVQFDLSGVPVK